VESTYPAVSSHSNSVTNKKSLANAKGNAQQGCMFELRPTANKI